MRPIFSIVSACLLCASLASAAEPIYGWRGNTTGHWPDAKSPITWQRIAKGALHEMRTQASRPLQKDPRAGLRLEKGLVREWLIAGPFPVADSEQELDRDLLGGEGALEPAEGGKVGAIAWQKLDAPWEDPDIFGNALVPIADFAPKIPFQKNQIAYAATWLHSPLGGQVGVGVQHSHGMKVWLNGEVVYRAHKRNLILGGYEGVSRYELNHTSDPSPRFEMKLRAGWNRLLVKVSTPPNETYKEQRFLLRLANPADVAYEAKNIAWMTELPGRSTSTPILVGSRLYLMAEPDQLVCLDAASGKIFWQREVNAYAALPPADKAALPAFAERIDPLIAELQRAASRDRRRELRQSIQKSLLDIDPKRFEPHYDGHFAAHFGIVGFTMPTPASDGRSIFVWTNAGVAACFDLEGERRWITVVPSKHLAYGSSPAVAEGVVAVFLEHLFGLDAKTGEILWEQPKIHKNIAAIQTATIRDQPVFVTQLSEIIRPKDGELLFRPPGATTDGSWAPPVVLDNKLYRPQHAVSSLAVYDCAEVEGDAWKPKLLGEIEKPAEIHRKADGSWIDRPTAGSALIHEGLAYEVDIYGWLYVSDVANRKFVYRQRLEHGGLMHYNAVPFAASPTLVGKHVMLFDNQGTCFVLEPGREFKLVATNRIETQLARDWPIPAQETLAYAPPICAGSKMYLRGERYLYCISP